MLHFILGCKNHHPSYIVIRKHETPDIFPELVRGKFRGSGKRRETAEKNSAAPTPSSLSRKMLPTHRFPGKCFPRTAFPENASP